MEDRFDVDQRAVEFDHVLIIFLRDHVEITQELEGFDQRERPPELASLSENNADVLAVFRPVLIRNFTVDEYLA